MTKNNKTKKEQSYEKVKANTRDDLCWIRRVIIDLYERDETITETECMSVLDSLFPFGEQDD